MILERLFSPLSRCAFLGAAGVGFSVLCGQEILEPLVVIGERVTEEEKEDGAVGLPGSVVEIPREVIERAAVGSVGELLEKEAGVPFISFFGNAETGTPLLRGFAENASSRVLILVDGLAVNRADLGAVPWLQFPLGQLERVSLLKGSRTVRYGSAALGGVISLETRRLEEGGGLFESSFGSDGLLRLRGRYEVPLGNWALSAQGEESESDGYRQNGGFDSTNWGVVLESPEEARVRGRWSLMGSDLLTENPGALSEREFREDPRQSRAVRFGQADEFFTETDSLRATQQVEWDLRDELKLEVNGSWFRRERATNFGPGSHGDNDSDSWATEAVLSGGGNWEVGVRWQRDDADVVRYGDIERTEVLGTADLRRDVFGVFALGRWDVSERWTVAGGVGWESYELEAQAQDELSPNNAALNFEDRASESGVALELAAEYEGEDWKGWFRYDRVYRFPVMDEIAGFQGFVLAEPFNADLEPERGHAVEVGAAGKWGDFDLSATVFAQWLEGEIAFDFRENLNVNFSDTRRTGLELMASWETEQWEARLSYTGTSARYASGPFEGSGVPLVPEHVLSGALTWLPDDDVSLSLEGLYVGASPEGNDFANEAEEVPSRVVFNTNMNWQVREDLALFLRVNNVLDQSFANLIFQGQWYPAAGRQVVTGFRWEF